VLDEVHSWHDDDAWELTNQVHYEGQAIVWVGPQEQAELFITSSCGVRFNNGSLEAA